MTIEKAILLLTNEMNLVEQHDLPRLAEAISLGIEALKTIKTERTIYGFKRQVRLPGETLEGE